jgi:hypothetical protein
MKPTFIRSATFQHSSRLGSILAHEGGTKYSKNLSRLDTLLIVKNSF